jgi:hypothetical protein
VGASVGTVTVTGVFGGKTATAGCGID